MKNISNVYISYVYISYVYISYVYISYVYISYVYISYVYISYVYFRLHGVTLNIHLVHNFFVFYFGALKNACIKKCVRKQCIFLSAMAPSGRPHLLEM